MEILKLLFLQLFKYTETTLKKIQKFRTRLRCAISYYHYHFLLPFYFQR